MKNYRLLVAVLSIALTFATVSCDDFDKGHYYYNDDNRPFSLEYVNGLLIQWGSDDLDPDVKEAVQEIVESMVYVPSGTFKMGSNKKEDEKPRHDVSLSWFYMAKVTVTQKQWTAIMGEENPLWSEDFGKGEDYPANFISYEQAQEFINRLNKYAGLTYKMLYGMQFRLPTEAEWEYAACGGRVSDGHTYIVDDYIYSGSDNADLVAWYRGNANGKMHISGELEPNRLGLYDMSGNVWEWCSDYYGGYTSGNSDNPTGPATGTKRVVRGGSFSYESDFCRCKARNSLPEKNQSVSVGLRLAVSK